MPCNAGQGCVCASLRRGRNHHEILKLYNYLPNHIIVFGMLMGFFSN